MSENPEQKKALVLWRLRRDLEELKALCLRFDREGVDKADLRKFLLEMNSTYEDLRDRLRR